MINPPPTSHLKWMSQSTIYEAVSAAEIGSYLTISNLSGVYTEEDVWFKIDKVSWKRHYADASTAWMTFFDNERMASIVYSRIIGDWWSIS